MSRGRLRLPIALVAGVVGLLFASLLSLALRSGPLGQLDLASEARGLLALLGLGEPLAGNSQTALELRLVRALAAAGVGAALALSGAFLQGVFRNGLASPSVLGVTAGAVLGASLALLVVGAERGAAELVLERAGIGAPLAVSGASFAGALAVSWWVLAFSSVGGRVSVPTLLLAGIAANTLLAGILAAVQSLVLKNYELSRALFSWTFGTLDDRSLAQVSLVWAALACALAAIPFVARELDLLAGGEDDAQALGVDVQRTKLVALVSAAFATAAAVSIAGQIAFVGLVVPHLVRLFAGTSHRAVLPLSAFLGAAFVLGCDVLGRALFPEEGLRPGVLLSLVGGPLFIVLLWRNRGRLVAW